MTQRIVKRTSEFATGKSGLAIFTKLSATMARVDFEDEATSYPLTIIPGGETKNIPDYFMFTKLAVNGKITVKITLTEKNDGVAFISPATAEEKAKFLWFSGGEETAPAPKTKAGVDKYNHPFKPSCGAVIEITEGKWKGCRLYAHLQYGFGSDDQGVFIYDGKNGEKLAEFMDAVGVGTSTLTASENLLPEIQKLAQENAREFSIFIEKGWVNRFMGDLNDDAAWTVDADTSGIAPADDEIGFLTPAQQDNIHPALAE